MGVNISGWDEKCSRYCDRNYAETIENDPDMTNRENYRSVHLGCMNGCFKSKKLSDRREFLR